MSSPAASSDSSSLSPPPSTLSSPSPPPESSSPSPPPQPRSAKAKPTTQKRKKQDKNPIKIILNLKGTAKENKKKPQAKPREPKIEPIPRSVVNNHDVPLVVLFRSRFRGLFSGTSELGPQDVEEGVSVEGDITGKLEEFVLRICTLIGNRRKSVERDQLDKVLQETVDTNFEKFGFRRDGINVSPMVNVTFATMDWDGRLQLLRALVHWALLSSDAVRQIIDDAYKVPPNTRVDRDELDVNTGLGVLPLSAIKGDNYYLVEGKDTRFRIYHETNPHHKIINITSVAHDKPSLVEFSETLAKEGNKLEQELSTIIKDTIIARIEAAEQRRVKAEQAALRLATWKASAPVYNTRTRGKKVDYSEFGKDSEDDDDEEEEGESDSRGRRSERRAAAAGERERVEYTASGRMVKRPRLNGVERTKMKDEGEESEEEMEWSVYSDKGETENDNDEDEGEEEEYEIGGRSLVIKLKVDKEGLKAATDGLVSMNGKSISPKTIHKPQHTPPQSSRFPSQQTHHQQSPGLSRQYQSPPQYHQYHQSPPRVYPTNTPPTHVAPIPYTGGSPPITFRTVQLSPQPIPRPAPPQDRPQSYQQPHPFQQSSYPQQSQYQTAQFVRPPPQTSPSTYPPTNGTNHTTPPYGSQLVNPKPATPVTNEWSPPRPFGVSPSVQESRPIQSWQTAALKKSDVSPHQQTWSAATFNPTPAVNGNEIDAVAKHMNGPGQSMSQDGQVIGKVNGQNI